MKATFRFIKAIIHLRHPRFSYLIPETGKIPFNVKHNAAIIYSLAAIFGVYQYTSYVTARKHQVIRRF